MRLCDYATMLGILTKKGDANKNLDWSCSKSEAFSVFDGTEGAKGDIDSLFVIPADVGVNDSVELTTDERI